MSAGNPEASGLTSLNDTQRRAVTSNAATVAILAGPGSGKTHTLASRVVWLVRHRGYRPSDIIVATFTVKAAREMRERIGKALGGAEGGKLVLGTFHSIARRYLASYGSRIGLDARFGIADDGDSRAILQRICKRLGLKVEPSYARSWISKRKSKGSAPAPARKQPDPPDLLTCFKEYQHHLERSNLLDYDDLLVRCAQLLREHASCVSNVQAVLIDEYQDTNGIQYDLMKLFAQTRQRITIVGDPDQSIYGWRSAEIRNLYRLLRDFPGTDEVSLEENYRSSQSILDFALQVIQQDKKRYQKVLRPVHVKGARPVLRKLKSSAAEGEWIVAELGRAVMLLGGMIKHQDVAILLRSASLSRHVEAALGKAGVPYRMIGGHKFYDRREIKILVDYLRVVHQPDNNDAVARIVNVPRRGIGETTIKSLLDEAEKAKMSVWSLLWKHCRGTRQATTNIRPKMEQKLNTELLRIISGLRSKADQMTRSSQYTLVELMEDLVGQLGFKRYLEEEYAEDHEGRWANVQELIGLAGDFARDVGKPDDEALPEIDGVEQSEEDDVLGRFLASIALASDAQRDDESRDTSAMVTVSTIHAAKGLEWPVVFVPSVYAGSIPHSRAEDLDEERRLLYVAMTRAQALLYLSCPLYGSLGLSNKVELSPFVSPFAARYAPKGPSFDRPVVEAAATILGRPAPTDKVVFDQLPPMFSPEDDAFPVEPFDAKSAKGLDDDGQNGHYSGARKRQRLHHASGGGGGGEGREEGERPWMADDATTMERSCDFTMSSLPGFVSAGAHQTALAAAAQAEARGPGGAREQQKAGAGRRQPEQKSLMGFVTGRLAKGPAAGPDAADGPMARYQAAVSRHASRQSAAGAWVSVAEATMDAALAQHRLPTGNILARPVGPRRDEEEEEPRKRYACFSSPPPCGGPSAEGGKADGGPARQAEAEASRPATSFHTTTFMSAKPQGGVRRPVGLGPAPSMDRLRKPFKPLTISRPKGPSG